MVYNLVIMKSLLIVIGIFLSISIYAQKSYKYKFDDNANVYGCANVFLQKISSDWQYELMVELKFDSITKYTELKIQNALYFLEQKQVP
jgi:hypothetical protein